MQSDHITRYASDVAADAGRYDFLENAKSTSMKSAGLVFFVIVLAGCGAAPLYEGPRLPENELVIVQGFNDTQLIGIGAVVCEFNEKKLEPCRTLVEIPPGMHKLKIRAISETFKTISRKVEIDFKPGDRYQISAEIKVGNGYLEPVIRKVGNANNK